ncbi:alpha/beta hydrolase [Legionella jordanis]|uniref:Alpha/beta hydrolase family protein n=2 Tax=Legionella jordanis TaxID=456 RepID=A0A0W0VEG4_9GAMM|nr:alpha/beta hydrolase [Legionella jordanis]KTD18025.1 Alpha/beta hydrolase family protein [Legionella jordanis]RMX02288.1 alpha/beta hydrolase [Legionella jordanis]RMX21227.1 alpha/beta hydrolase [Legionella jordanis]VEH13883.1 Bem46 protein [Legionella jordanis]
MIKQILLTSCLILVALTCLFYMFQRHLMYLPAKEVPNPSAFHAQDMQVVNIETSDGLILHSWYKKAIPPNPTLLYLHGNAGHIGYRMPLVRQFLSAGFGVLLLEYRGYGGNPGRPSEQGLYQDGMAAMSYLEKHGVSSQHIVVYGESLGTAVATYLAAKYPVCAMVLQSPFTSMSALARYHYPWALIPPWDKFDSLSRINLSRAPLLILHGEQDSITPYAGALLLFQHAHQPKQFSSLPAKGHNDLWDFDFASKVMTFMRASCF